MKAKFNKYYLLNLDHEYWSIDLQRMIKFTNKLVVKCTSTYQHQIYYGNLVNTSEVYDDLVTNNEIAFSPQDIIKEYKLHKMPLIFFDFIYANK